MLRAALFVTIAAIVGLTALSEIGVNIAPLLAGAGIVGVAIGFGSQKLVQDVVTGMFVLFENAIQVGDWVTVAGLSGKIERLSVRTIWLRGGDGALQIVPFSSVGTITNTNRGLGTAAVSVTIAYGEDSDRAADAMRGIAAGDAAGAGIRRQDARRPAALGGFGPGLGGNPFRAPSPAPMPGAGRCSVSSTAVCKSAFKHLVSLSASSSATRRRDMMAESGRSNGAALAAYMAKVGERPLPPEVADRARLCLADWLGPADARSGRRTPSDGNRAGRKGASRQPDRLE